MSPWKRQTLGTVCLVPALQLAGGEMEEEALQPLHLLMGPNEPASSLSLACERFVL